MVRTEKCIRILAGKKCGVFFEEHTQFCTVRMKTSVQEDSHAHMLTHVNLDGHTNIHWLTKPLVYFAHYVLCLCSLPLLTTFWRRAAGFPQESDGILPHLFFLISAQVPAPLKHPHNRMLTPPCFTVGMMFLDGQLYWLSVRYTVWCWGHILQFGSHLNIVHFLLGLSMSLFSCIPPIQATCVILLLHAHNDWPLLYDFFKLLLTSLWDALSKCSYTVVLCVYL